MDAMQAATAAVDLDHSAQTYQLTGTQSATSTRLCNLVRSPSTQSHRILLAPRGAALEQVICLSLACSDRADTLFGSGL